MQGCDLPASRPTDVATNALEHVVSIHWERHSFYPEPNQVPHCTLSKSLGELRRPISQRRPTLTSKPNNEAGAGPPYSFNSPDVKAAGCNRVTAQSIAQTSFAEDCDISESAKTRQFLAFKTDTGAVVG